MWKMNTYKHLSLLKSPSAFDVVSLASRIPNRILLGPGPSNCSQRVLNALSYPTIGHLHPEFIEIMDDVREGVKYFFQTRNPYTMVISGTGHLGMEAGCVNLVEPGEKVLVHSTGIWGQRFADLVKRQGGIPIELRGEPGTAIPLEDFSKAIEENRPAVVFVTHGESSTGVHQPLDGLGALCRASDSILLVDSVASLGGEPLMMDDLNIDVMYTGSQKVLSVSPGLSMISYNDRAIHKIRNRKTKCSSWYLDALELGNYWGCDNSPRRYHHTAPVNSIYGLWEGLATLCQEGLQPCWERHAVCSGILHHKIKKLGLEFFVKDKHLRLPTITTVKVPDGVEWKTISDYILHRFGIEIAGGLGPTANKVWRIGLMGHNATETNVNLLYVSLKTALEEVGYKFTQPRGDCFK